MILFLFFLLQLNNYKNIEEGTVGRILSYYDLSDRKALIMKDDETKSEEEEEVEQAKMEEELKKELVEEQEKLKEEEEARRVLEEEEQTRMEEEQEEEKQRLENRSDEQKLREEERGSKDPVSSEEIFRSVNRRRASLAMAKNKKVDTSKGKHQQKRTFTSSHCRGEGVCVCVSTHLLVLFHQVIVLQIGSMVHSYSKAILLYVRI